MTNLTTQQRIAVLSVLRGDASEAAACTEAGIDAATFRAWERALLTGKLRPDEGHLDCRSLHQHARIRRDRWGVAHCSAEKMGDLCFAAGVAQAQDRLWQLDYRRRLASGRLAAILGEGSLSTDCEHRTLGFRRIVETQEQPGLPAEAVEALEGFAAGVNAWIDVASHDWPLEFEILGYEPEPWTVTDSLAILRYFWWTLTGRLSQLVAAERLLRGVPREQAAWFLTPETISTIVPGDDTSSRRDDLWEAGLRVEELPGGSAAADDPSQTPGSNNWAAQTAQGPVLAADPHWPLAFPDMWYEQHLSGAGLDVIGPAYPGAPPVVFGRTLGMAWGRTNNVSSTRDLYIHETDPADPVRYRTVSGWERFSTLNESIEVAGGATVEHGIQLTAEGRPVVNEYIPAVDEGGDAPISLRWVGQEAIGDVQVLLDLGRAQTVNDALTVFGRWRLSVWNCVIADTQGHMAYQMCGSVPRRSIPTRGTRPAHQADHQWTGYTDTPDLPSERDPGRGWVASANNPPILPGTKPPLYGTYADGYRYDRIGRYLSDGPLSPDQVGDLQADNLSLRAEELAGVVASRLRQCDVVQAASMASHLDNWNHRFDATQVGASLWSVLWPRLVTAVGRQVLPAFVAQLNAANAGRLVRQLLLSPPDADAPVFPGLDFPAALVEATSSTLAYLQPILGDHIEEWSWQRLQSMRLHHPLATNDAARRVLNPPVIPCDGGNGVVNNRAARETVTGLEVSGGPSYRLVADLSGVTASGCLLAGQSGQPGHRHYADQLALWPSGQRHPLHLEETAIDAECTGKTFELRAFPLQPPGHLNEGTS